MWYKSTDKNYINFDKHNGKCYVLTKNNEWIETILELVCVNTDNLIEVSPDEIKEVLINQAIHRGIDKYQHFKTHFEDNYVYFSKEDRLTLNGHFIYNNGTWAFISKFLSIGDTFEYNGFICEVKEVKKDYPKYMIYKGNVKKVKKYGHYKSLKEDSWEEVKDVELIKMLDKWDV